MKFKIVIPPTGEEYTSTDLNSVRAFFIREYEKLARHGNIDYDTQLTADVLVYTPDYVLGYCQFEG